MRKIYTTLVLIAISISAIAQLKVVENGDIGIGTTAPTNSKLDLLTGTDAVALRLSHPTAPTEAAYDIKWDGTNANVVHRIQYSSTYYEFLKVNRDSRNVTFNGGNVGIGIGIADPNEKLTVAGNITLTENSSLINLGESGASGPHGFIFDDPDGSQLKLVYRSTPNQLIVEHTDSEEDIFSIDADTDVSYFKGNLGIGTTSPAKKLDVNGDINYTGDLYKDGELVDLTGGGSSNWTESGTNIFYNDGNVGINTTNPGQKLYVNGSISTRYGEYLYLNSSTDNNWIFGKDLSKNIILTGVGISSESRRFYVYDEYGSKEVFSVNFYSGKVGIGCSPTEKLDVNGNVRANQFLVSSDKRLKKNIKNIEKGLDKLVKVRGVEYNLLAENEQPNRFKYNSNLHIGDAITDTTGFDRTEMNVIDPNKQQIGFIAQEVQVLYPELVSVDEDGFFSIDYIGFIPLLVEAIKEQQTKVNKNGISVGEMNGKLLHKIEELTLNTVQQKDIVDNQQSLINNQQELIKGLLKRVEKLENK